MDIKIIPSEDWKLFSRGIHSLVFDQERSAELDRISYAILMVRNEEAVGYATVIETAADTAYLQYGGAMPEHRGTALVYRGYLKILDYIKSRYKHIYTKVFHENIVYLKMCLNAGFKISGTCILKNQPGLFVDLYLEGNL